MQAFPFDSELTFDEHDNPIYDRVVSSQPLRKLIKELFTTGVMPNPSTNFQVSAGSDGMTVQVAAGFAVIDGGLCHETETRTLEVTAADNTYDRIDTVVLRWNENVDVRTADLYVVAGTPAVNPVRPTLQRNNSIYEIGLADVFITKRVATITTDKITDTRYEAERCGVVSSISEFDTTTLYQQIQADLVGFKSTEQANFMSWFANIQSILDENAAGHLQNEIDGLSNSVSQQIEEINSDLTDIATSSQIGSGTKNFSISNTQKRLLCVAKKSGKIVESKEIPISVLETGNVIPLGDKAPVVWEKGPAGTPDSNAIGKQAGINQQAPNTWAVGYYFDETTTPASGNNLTYPSQQGLVADLSSALGASITYNGSNSFTITVTDSTLSVYVY